MPERQRRPFREFLKELGHPEIAVGGGLAAAVLLGLLGYQVLAPVALGDVMVEAWGLLFDVVLFGFLLVWVNVRRAKKDQIERYVEELEDYRRLETELGAARSAGILVRLAKSGGGDRAPGGMYLAKADLRGTDLNWAHLSQADLRGANLSRAHLQGADLSGANLNRADLRGAHLVGADFGGAYLHGAYLCGADLNEAHFKGADLSGAHLRGADLSGVLNLEQWRLDSGLGDRSTKLPDGLRHPELWPEERSETQS